MPPLRMLLVLDNLAGHKSPAFVLWLFSMVMPWPSPGGQANMAEPAADPEAAALDGSSLVARRRSSRLALRVTEHATAADNSPERGAASRSGGVGNDCRDVGGTCTRRPIRYQIADTTNANDPISGSFALPMEITTGALRNIGDSIAMGRPPTSSRWL